MDQFGEFWTGSFPDATVEIILKDGTKLSQTMRYPKGHPKNKFTWAEQVDMFKKQASVALSEERIEKLVKAVENIEDIDDFSTVGELTFMDKD